MAKKNADDMFFGLTCNEGQENFKMQSWTVLIKW